MQTQLTLAQEMAQAREEYWNTPEADRYRLTPATPVARCQDYISTLGPNGQQIAQFLLDAYESIGRLPSETVIQLNYIRRGQPGMISTALRIRRRLERYLAVTHQAG